MNRSVQPFTHRRRGFTLIELMISLALMVLLMLGVNFIFTAVGGATGSAQTLSKIGRDIQATQNVLARDFSNMAVQGPSIIIWSERVSAFRSNKDLLSDGDFIPTDSALNLDLHKRTIDNDGNLIEGEASVAGEITPELSIGDRSHRVDTMSFFARDTYSRQTGGYLNASNNMVDEYVSDLRSTEAWIWYGHLRRPDFTSPTSTKQAYTHRDPGEEPRAKNANNYFSSDWILGRAVILLAEGDDTDGDGIGDEIRDSNNQRQMFVRRRDAVTDGTSLAPFVSGIETSETGSSDRWQIQWYRYDLANTSISQFNDLLTNYSKASNATPWYSRMGNWRFQGDPLPPKPLTAAGVSRTSDVFLEHCSDFVVEFAGNFLTQDASQNGKVTAAAPDASNEIDYIEDNSSGILQRRIRWYGMPRDVAGAPGGAPDGVILGRPTSGTDVNTMVDVVPLRDVIIGAGLPDPSTIYPAPNPFIERTFPAAAPAANYAAPGAVLPTAQYVVAWGPDTLAHPRPSMIRIVMVLDDPNGRLKNGMTFEYVYKVQ